jgi:hypothetical protein
MVRGGERRPLLLVAGRVRTADPTRPTARAVLTSGDRIAWVGDHPDEAPALAGAAPLRLDLDGAEVHPAFVSNTDPWTYLGSTPVRLNPGCSFDGGLGLFALRSIGLPTVLNHVRQALGSAGTRSGRRLLRHDDVESLTISCDEPVNFQVDGDLVGKRTRVEFTSVTDALTVVV